MLEQYLSETEMFTSYMWESNKNCISKTE